MKLLARLGILSASGRPKVRFPPVADIRGRDTSGMLVRSAVFSALVAALATACAPGEAGPADMQEAATVCGIRSFAVAATRDASQSPYALHHVAEGDDRAKLDCYRARLQSKGLRPTLALGSAGGLETHGGLLFARVSETCGLPRASTITQQAGKVTVYGAADLAERHRACTTMHLRQSGRFSDIQFSDDLPPAGPRIGL